MSLRPKKIVFMQKFSLIIKNQHFMPQNTLKFDTVSNFCFLMFLSFWNKKNVEFILHFGIWPEKKHFLSSAYVVSPGPTSWNSFFHSVSNFLGIQLANGMVAGSGSDIPLIQDIEPSNSRARLSHATLRFFSLAEQCHTSEFLIWRKH